MWRRSLRFGFPGELRAEAPFEAGTRGEAPRDHRLADGHLQDGDALCVVLSTTQFVTAAGRAGSNRGVVYGAGRLTSRSALSVVMPSLPEKSQEGGG